MKVKIEIELQNSADVTEAISAVAEIYDMSGSTEETTHIEGGGQMHYKIELEDSWES